MTTTTTTALESVQAVWSTADEQFFRMAAELFPPRFLSGAGVLLASYDPEPVDRDDGVPTAVKPVLLRPAAAPVAT